MDEHEIEKGKRIDAACVSGGLLLLFFCFIYVMPNEISMRILGFVGSYAVGAWIAKLGLRIRWGSDKKTIREQLALMGRMAECMKSLVEVSNAQQAQIDSLMLEYCPEEMTPVQLGNWAANQKSVDPETQAMINKALKDSLH